jgi:hypothetical protein
MPASIQNWRSSPIETIAIFQQYLFVGKIARITSAWMR